MVQEIAKKFLGFSFQNKLNRIKKFKDAHKGEACYIFGDGISIKWFDLKEFSNYHSIPVTYIPFHKQFNCLNVSYLLLTEPWYFYPYFKTTIPPFEWWRNRIQNEYRNLFSLYPEKQFFINLSNYPVARRKNVNYLFQTLPEYEYSSIFKNNNINYFDGSIRSSISFAIYLGFQKIYLVGFDYTHNPSKSLHWYEKGEGVITDLGEYNKDFFSIVTNYADITTITVDSTSKYLHSIKYEDFTGKKPIYKENTELMDIEMLELLATWPDYKIF